MMKSTSFDSTSFKVQTPRADEHKKDRHKKKRAKRKHSPTLSVPERIVRRNHHSAVAVTDAEEPKMPELPEVEAARKAIEDNCLGKRIKKSIVANDSKVIDGVSASDFEASLSGKTIIAAHRKGKNLWLELDSPPFPSFQFGMTGAVYIKGVAVTKYKRSAVKDGEEWPSKYSKVFIELDDGMEFSFTDKRRFAKVRLLKDPASVPPISELGPDALLEPMTEDEFVASLSKKKITIKPLLLDQGYISGIGNWIADEVLYQAKIHPLQVASSLSKESCAALQKCIKEVIEKAVEVGADNSQYPNNWIFHTREKKPGKAFVDGKKIEFITAGGRTTAFVPELQKLTGNQAAKAVSQQRKQSNQRKGRQDESDSDDDDAQETDEGDVAAKTKGKKETKPSGQTKKKVPAKRKSEESDDGTDEEDNVAENTKLKKGTKAKGQLKKVPAKRKSEESDEGTAEEDNVAENTKLKKGTKAKGQVKKASAKRKSKESDDDEDDDGTDEDDHAENTKPKKGTKAKGQTKKNVPAKRKSIESDEEENEDDGSGEDYKVQKKRSKKVTNDKQSKAGKTTKKKVQPSQTIKNVKKK